MSTSDFNQTSLLLESCQANLTSLMTAFSMLQMNLSDINDQFNNCTIALAAAGSTDTGTDAEEDTEIVIYNRGLHIAAVFIIFIASMLGTLFPLLSKYHPGFSIDPYYIILGKCSGIGIIISCALVHMIQPASESLTDSSLPYEFTDGYPAYAFLFAVIGALLMHFTDFILETLITKHMMDKAISNNTHINMDGHGHGHQQGTEMTTIPQQPEHQQVGSHNTSTIPDQLVMSCHVVSRMYAGDTLQCNADVVFMCVVQSVGDVMSATSISIASPTTDADPDPATLSVTEKMETPNQSQYFENKIIHDHSVQGHSHGGALLASSKRTLAAYLLEFGVTVHSIFIGLENGVVGEDELKKLLVALVFHQFFEGIALGSRLADANLSSHLEEMMLSIIFAISSPLGIAIGIGLTESIHPDGVNYLITQGVFDGICGGILLYIGFLLLFRDFPEDMKRFVNGHKHEIYRKCGMFIALWIGAGLMAFIGKYL